MTEEKPEVIEHLQENSIYEFVQEKYYKVPEIESLTKQKVPEIQHMASVILYFCINNSINQKIASVLVEFGIIKKISIKRKDLGETGEITSFLLADLEENLRYKEIKKYLKTSYLTGSNFDYDRLRQTNNIIEPLKLSGSLNIKNAPVRTPQSGISFVSGKRILVSGIETGEKETIIKKAEFSKEFDPNMIIRCMPHEETGVHKIFIYREFIQQCLNNLTSEHRALIYLMIMPGKRVQGLRAKQDELQKLFDKCSNTKNYKAWDKVKREAFDELLKIIIDDEREYMSKKLGLYQNGGMINKKRVEYIKTALKDEQPQQMSKAWYKKKGIEKK
jgi:hypothetical protein